MSKTISKAMKDFWSQKSKEEMTQINSKRSNSNSQCIYIIKKGERVRACRIENIFSKIAEGYKVVKSRKNLKKIKKNFNSFPENFFN